MKEFLIIDKGFSLIELTVTLSVATILGLMAIEVSRQQNLSELIQNRTLQAASEARQFFDVRGKVFRNGTSATLGNELLYGTTRFYDTLSIDSSNARGIFNENISNLCSIARPFDFALSLTQAEQDLLNQCSPACAGKIPKIRIARGNVAETFPAGNGTGRDGEPMGAALCIRANTNDANFSHITLQVLMLILIGEDKVKLTPYEATFPRPHPLNPNSIRLLGTSRE